MAYISLKWYLVFRFLKNKETCQWIERKRRFWGIGFIVWLSENGNLCCKIQDSLLDNRYEHLPEVFAWDSWWQLLPNNRSISRFTSFQIFPKAKHTGPNRQVRHTSLSDEHRSIQRRWRDQLYIYNKVRSHQINEDLGLCLWPDTKKNCLWSFPRPRHQRLSKKTL